MSHPIETQSLRELTERQQKRINDLEENDRRQKIRIQALEDRATTAEKALEHFRRKGSGAADTARESFDPKFMDSKPARINPPVERFY